VLLRGSGGVGESKALTVVAERFAREEAERFAREEADRFVVPILLLEPTPPDQGPYLRLDFYWQIIDALKTRDSALHQVDDPAKGDHHTGH
jgi:hypothetical protein